MQQSQKTPLPSFSSIRTTEIKTLLTDEAVSLTPFTNKDILRLDQFIEDIKKRYETNSKEYRISVDNFLKDYIVKPHTDIQSDITYIDGVYLFVEQYKISKGTTIPMVYTCEKCGYQSEHQFDLEKNVKVSSFTQDDITVDDIIFKLQPSSFNLQFKPEDDTYNKNMTTLFYVSFIKEMEYSNEKFTLDGYTDEEILQWVENDLNVGVWDRFVTKLQKQIPSVQFSYHFSCKNPNCQFKEPEETRFPTLPDFSLGLL